MDTPLEAAAKFRRAAARIDTGTRRGEHAAAAYVRAQILGLAPKRLRNVGRKGANLRVGIFPSKTSGTVVAAGGPWQIIENDTKAHVIGGGRSKRREVRQYLQFNGGDHGIRLGPVMHPGTRGSQPFTRGVELARPAVPRIIDGEIKVALLQTFGV